MEPGRLGLPPPLCHRARRENERAMGCPALPADRSVSPEGTTMEIVYAHCAGIDVHKQTAVVTVGWRDDQGQPHKQTRTFGTMTRELEQLREWLVESSVTHVAMACTGVYWKPIFSVLEAAGLMVV